jgi:hypothetical protein
MDRKCRSTINAFHIPTGLKYHQQVNHFSYSTKMTRFLYLVGLIALVVGTTSARSITFAVEKDETELTFTNDVLESTPIRPGWYNKVMNLLDNFRGGSIIFV